MMNRLSTLELFLNKLFGAIMGFNYLFLLSRYLFRNNSIVFLFKVDVLVKSKQIFIYIISGYQLNVW